MGDRVRPAGSPPSPSHDAETRQLRRLIDDIESIAGLGWYSLDVRARRWTSSPGLDRIFGIGPTFERSVDGWASLIHPADRDAMVAYFSGEVLGLGRPFEREYRIVRPDTGEPRWVHGRGALEFDDHRRPRAMLGTIADVTGRREAQEALLRSERRYAAVFEGAIEGILIADVASRRLRWANPALCRLLGYTLDELLGLAIDDIHSRADLPRALEQFQALADGAISEVASLPCLRKDGSVFLADVRGSRAVIDGVACNVGFFVDVTELRRLELAQQRLALAVEQATDAVIITDPAAAIQYVNPAYERLSGYRSDEVVGQNPRIVRSDLQSADVYAAMWQALVAGQAWTGDLINRRRDGSLYHVEATITPLRGSEGGLIGYVGIERDVTHERALEADIAREARERAIILAALERIEPRGPLTDIAAAICEQLEAAPGLGAVVIWLFEGHDAQTVGLASSVPLPLRVGTTIPRARAKYLRSRAAQGPWVERWRVRRADGRYGAAVAAGGIKAVAYLPLSNHRAVFGLLAVGSLDPSLEPLFARLPNLAMHAAIISNLLGPGAERQRLDSERRGPIAAIVAERAVTPVFQPIVDMPSGAVLGYEALSRFAAGPPDQVLAQAAEVGLGLELEDICLDVAIAAAAALPPEMFLTLNASPSYLLDPGRLAGRLAPLDRDVVIEVSEHDPIDDYAAIRRAVAVLGPRVRLAVDDAGAGFASLRHVIELRPDIVKLDVGLVGGLARDPMREAVVAGLVHYAAQAATSLIAEGVETELDRAALHHLGVVMGQGYLFGRPAPLFGVVGTDGRSIRPSRGLPVRGRDWSSTDEPIPRSVDGDSRGGIR